MKRHTESDLLRAVMQFLALHGVWCWRTNAAAVPLSGGGFRKFNGLRGVSDLIGCADDGRIIAIETKSATGTLRKEQAEFIANVRKRGGVAIVARSLTELEDGLRAEGVIA